MFKTAQPKWKKKRWVTVLDLVVLLDNVFLGAQDTEVGFEDCKETLKSFTMRLNEPIKIHTEDLETALWSANLLNEKKRFRHPQGISFDQFLTRVLRGDSFNKEYNFIEGEKGHEL